MFFIFLFSRPDVTFGIIVVLVGWQQRTSAILWSVEFNRSLADRIELRIQKISSFYSFGHFNLLNFFKLHFVLFIKFL